MVEIRPEDLAMRSGDQYQLTTDPMDDASDHTTDHDGTEVDSYQLQLECNDELQLQVAI